MKGNVLFLTALLVVCSLAAQAQGERDSIRTPRLAVKGRLFLVANGLGVEYSLSRRHSVEVYGVASFYTWTPSIDMTQEAAGIAAYRYYLNDGRSNKSLRRWYVSPFFKYGDVTPGYGNIDFNAPFAVRSHRFIPGVVLGRQVLFGRRRHGLFEWFVGPQYVVARDRESIPGDGSATRQTTRQFWSVRAGVDLGVAVYRRTK